MTYTLHPVADGVIRDQDQAYIPNDPDNVDWQDYQAWLAEGNEPTPYTSPPTAKAGEDLK